MNKNFLQTGVAATGEFIYGIHKPKYTASNLRQNDYIITLGHGPDHTEIDNTDNFPADNIHVASSAWVFGIPNAFPFMGAGFVLKTYADGATGNANRFKGEEESSPARSLEKYEPAGDLSLENPPPPLACRPPVSGRS